MASTPFFGQVQAFAFSFAPKGWAFCAGQLMPINQNQALFSLLGTTYGGDGISTFALPNLQGRAVRGYGSGTGVSPCNMGQLSGTENVSLTVLQMPVHNHNLVITPGTGPKVSSQPGTSPTPSATANTLGALTDATITATNNFYNNLQPDTNLNTGSPAPSLSYSGNSQPVNIMQPFEVVNYCIATQGIYPSRN